MNYRTISTGFWSDRKVEDNFTPEDKYFYLYLLTNDHTNICGCYEIGMKTLTEDTGYNRGTIRKLLERFERVHDVIRYSEATGEILLLNWHKYNWSKSEKLITAVKKVSVHIKDEQFREYVLKILENPDNSKQITVNSNSIQNTVTDTDVSIEYEYPIDRVSKKKKEPVVYFPEDEALQDAFDRYREHRKKLKKPLDDYKSELAVKKLMKLADNNHDLAIQILEQSIEQGWVGLFELKDKKQNNNPVDDWLNA